MMNDRAIKNGFTERCKGGHWVPLLLEIKSDDLRALQKMSAWNYSVKEWVKLIKNHTELKTRYK